MKNIIEKMKEIKKTSALLQSEGAKKAWEQFERENAPVAEIERPHAWGKDFVDRYRIYRVGDDFILLTIDEYWCLGTEDADSQHSSEKTGYHISLEPVEWLTKEVTFGHWEDGKMTFTIADLPENKAKYFMKLAGPTGFQAWKYQEYRDFGCRYDDPEYDEMWYR